MFHHLYSAKGREHASPLTRTVPVEFSSERSKKFPAWDIVWEKNSRPNRILYIIMSYANYSITPASTIHTAARPHPWPGMPSKACLPQTSLTLLSRPQPQR